MPHPEQDEAALTCSCTCSARPRAEGDGHHDLGAALAGRQGAHLHLLGRGKAPPLLRPCRERALSERPPAAVARPRLNASRLPVPLPCRRPPALTSPPRSARRCWPAGCRPRTAWCSRWEVGLQGWGAPWGWLPRGWLQGGARTAGGLQASPARTAAAPLPAHALHPSPKPVDSAPARCQDDLARARQSFVMTTELHLTYLCVPVGAGVAYLDWARFQNMLGTLTVRALGAPWLRRMRGWLAVCSAVTTASRCSCALTAAWPCASLLNSIVHAPPARPPLPPQPAELSVSQKVGVDRAFVMRMARGIGGRGAQGEEAAVWLRQRLLTRACRALAGCEPAGGRQATSMHAPTPHPAHRPPTAPRRGEGAHLQALLDSADPHRHHCRGGGEALIACLLPSLPSLLGSGGGVQNSAGSACVDDGAQH